MKLAKPCIDIGIYTNRLDEQLSFWGETVGLPYDELLKVGGGVHQHRHSLNGSIFKLNHTREPLGENDPTGYHRLLIAREGQGEVENLVDPDGNNVSLVPPGYQGVEQIGIELKVSSLARYRTFYREVLQIEEVDENAFRWGNSSLFIGESDRPSKPMISMRGAPGYRYLTVQVFAVDREHQAFVDRGGESASDPATLGSTARISFIKDPDGNWIEISQRASLTGSLDVQQ